MAWTIGGRKLYIARFKRAGDRKVHLWQQWHKDVTTARVAFRRTLDAEFRQGWSMISVKAATAGEEKKIRSGHPLRNPVDLLSAAIIGATAGATGAFVRKRMERTAEGKNPAFPGKPGERFALKLHGKPAGGRKQAACGGWKVEDYSLKAGSGSGRHVRKATRVIAPDGRKVDFIDKIPKGSAIKQAKAYFKRNGPNPAGTGFSIAMVPRKGPRLLLPRVYGSKAEAQQKARKIRRPFGTRTAIVAAARNPYEAAAAASEGFHGRAVEEKIEIVTPEHRHDYLAAVGQLIKLEVLAPDSDREIIPLKGFDGSWLSMNEKRNQLFICGGDQSLTETQLQQFGVDLETLHETEVLGPLAACTYYTVKYHLGDEGGEADYRHLFGEEGGKLPVLIYRVRDRQVEIAGGSYTIPDEGVTN